jgi:hypothetical protein
MPRMVCPFRQRDLTRAIRGARAAGLTVVQAWIDLEGKIMLGFANNDSVIGSDPQRDANPWDRALAS